MRFSGSVFLILVLSTSSLASEPGNPGMVEFPTKSSTLLRMIKRGSIVIGMQQNYEPFQIASPRAGFPGIDPELAMLLGEALNLKVEFRFALIPELIRQTQIGDVDVALGGISSSIERARQVAFSDPYVVTTPAGLMAKKSLPREPESVEFPRLRIRGLSGLKVLNGLTLGAHARTTTEQLLREGKDFQKHHVLAFENRPDALRALWEGKIDVLVADRVYLKALILRNPEMLSRFQPLFDSYREDHLCMTLPQGDPEFVQYINFFIKELKRTGQLSALMQKYIESEEWLP